MKQHVHTFFSFVNEGKRTWVSHNLPFTLEDVKSLESYKNLQRFGIVDASSELQQKRLNFRLKLPTWAVTPKRVETGRWVKDGPSPAERRIGHIQVFDISQRSGRIQVYWAQMHGRSDAEKQTWSGANMIKSLGHPMETLEDYNTMFNHVAKYLTKKKAKPSEFASYSYRDDIGPEEYEQLRLDHDLISNIEDIW